MKTYFQKLLLVAVFVVCGCMSNAQMPNEKFGKPTNLEWDFTGWGDAVDADAIILCKTMKATYVLSDQVSNFNESSTDISSDNITDFGKNELDVNNGMVKYEFRLRTKILKPEGAKHANIDITYYHLENNSTIIADELYDMKIRVFTKNEKGKMEKRKVNTDSFVTERIDDNYVVMHVVVPDVQAGSIIEYEYNIISPRPAFIYDWVFQECIPTVRSKCEVDIPAFLKFNVNAPVSTFIRSSVEVGHLTYDANRADLKRAKSCATNRYQVFGDYVLPEGTPLKHTRFRDNDTAEKVADLTCRVATPGVTAPVYMPEGHTHLRIK